MWALICLLNFCGNFALMHPQICWSCHSLSHLHHFTFMLPSYVPHTQLWVPLRMLCFSACHMWNDGVSTPRGIYELSSQWQLKCKLTVHHNLCEFPPLQPYARAASPIALLPLARNVASDDLRVFAPPLTTATLAQACVLVSVCLCQCAYCHAVASCKFAIVTALSSKDLCIH